MHDQATDETRDSAKPADDQTGEVALRERISSAADHCRNALQMLLGLRLLADKVASLPGNLLQPWFSQDLRILADWALPIAVADPLGQLARSPEI